jgi:hypothetical protein
MQCFVVTVRVLVIYLIRIISTMQVFQSNHFLQNRMLLGVIKLVCTEHFFILFYLLQCVFLHEVFCFKTLI